MQINFISYSFVFNFVVGFKPYSLIYPVIYSDLQA